MAGDKNVPQIRFKGFTDAWEQRKLGEIVVIERGGSPRPIEKYITNALNGFNWVKIGDAPSFGRYITQTAEKIKPEGLSKTRQVYPGDLLLSNSMSFGRPYIMAVKGCIHDGWLLIRDTNKQFDLTYMCFMLSTAKMHDQYRRLAAGSTVNNLNKDLVGNANVSVPSKNEQKITGELLENFDHLIALHQRKLEKLKQFKSAMLEKMFPKEGSDKPEIRFAGFTDAWEQRKLGDYGPVQMCRRIYKEQTAETGEVPFFKIGTFGGRPDAFIANELFEKYRDQYPFPKIGMPLISAAGSIGRIVIYQGEHAYYQDSNIVWLDHDEKLEDAFLANLYEQMDWKLEGSTIKRLYNKDILNAEALIPGLPEQRIIGAFFTRVDHLIALHQRKLEKLKQLKSAMLEKMFV